MDTTSENLTPEEVSKRYKGKITVRTLANWRSRGDGPKFMRVGGRIVYPLKHLEAWEESRTVQSTSQYVAARQ